MFTLSFPIWDMKLEFDNENEVMKCFDFLRNVQNNWLQSIESDLLNMINQNLPNTFSNVKNPIFIKFNGIIKERPLISVEFMNEFEGIDKIFCDSNKVYKTENGLELTITSAHSYFLIFEINNLKAFEISQVDEIWNGKFLSTCVPITIIDIPMYKNAIMQKYGNYILE